MYHECIHISHQSQPLKKARKKAQLVSPSTLKIAHSQLPHEFTQLAARLAHVRGPSVGVFGSLKAILRAKRPALNCSKPNLTPCSQYQVSSGYDVKGVKPLTPQKNSISHGQPGFSNYAPQKRSGYLEWRQARTGQRIVIVWRSKC